MGRDAANMNDLTTRPGFKAFRFGTASFMPGRPAAVPQRPLEKRERPPEPTVAELVSNFTGAVTRWFRSGTPVVTEAQYQARTLICEGCEFYDAQAWLGFGKCRHKKCGCTRFKRLMATEKCPEGKWPLLS